MFGGGRGGFVRARVSRLERGLSWLVLGGIAATGAAVYLAGQTYDESLFGLDPASLSIAEPGSIAKPGRTAANTIVVPSLYQRHTGAAAVSPGPAGVLSGLQVPGWAAESGVERFTPATLYEKINGRAEQYISYDVVGLSCISLTGARVGDSVAGDSAAGSFLDLYVYDMGTPERAFGIFSVERDPAADPVDLGRRGYRSGASLFLWHGSYYVQILASSDDDELRTAAHDAGARLLAGLPDAGSKVAGLAQLAAPGMIANSEKYYARNALGFGFLTRTWSAEYLVQDKPVTLFVSMQNDDAGADQVVAGYRQYLTDFGAQIHQTERQVGNASDAGTETFGDMIFGDMDGYYDVVLRHGSRVAGAALLEDRQFAHALAEQLLPELVRGN